jgi:hypothetical protein
VLPDCRVALVTLTVLLLFVLLAILIVYIARR